MSTPEPAFDLDALLPELIELRRDLHRHPELGFEERRTQGIVRAWLDRFGYRPRDCAQTGLVADLEGVGDGPTIALRADMDALPMPEHSDLPWRSVHDGVAHKCGHDGHTTVLCGVAAALAARRGELPGRVRLIFQPDEEGTRGGGGDRMVAEGALDGVRELYGMHNWPGFPKGELRVMAGPVMARNTEIRLRLIGRGGHGSAPETCIDPITAGAQLVAGVDSLMARGIGHRGGAVISITAFQAGTTNNVIPGEALLLGTLRAFDEGLADRLKARLRELVEAVAKATGVSAELELRDGYPVLVNDAYCVDVVRAAAADVLGAEAVSDEGLPLAASEDFAFMARAVPAAFFFVGAGVAGEDTPSCHHPDFDFDDQLIGPSIRTFLGIVQRSLRR